MIEQLLKLKKLIGKTPLVRLSTKANIYAKLENYNYTGSIKDRAVNNILYNAINNGLITEGTKIIESSSGNFAISAALHCRHLGLEFHCVIDPSINELSKRKLELLASNVIMVDEPDETGGYLLNRIRKVKEILAGDSGFYWTNQYENKYNYLAYKDLGEEIMQEVPDLDYIFISVSSTGTITGLSQFLKMMNPSIKVIAVDVKGSKIFSSEDAKRMIPGIGAGKRSVFLEHCVIDDVIILSNEEIIEGCNMLLKEHSLFMGGSSGASYYAALKYLDKWGVKSMANSIIICPDNGTAYLNTIYSPAWVEEHMAGMKKRFFVKE